MYCFIFSTLGQPTASLSLNLATTSAHLKINFSEESAAADEGNREVNFEQVFESCINKRYKKSLLQWLLNKNKEH